MTPGARLTPQAAKDVSLAIARWAIGVVLNGRGARTGA